MVTPAPAPKRLSSHVLKAVLSVYFAVVLTQITVQFVVEFAQAEKDIKEELAGLESIFSEPLTAALWASTTPQVEALASSISRLPIVAGIEIINEESGLQVTEFLAGKSDLFHRFHLFYTFDRNSVYLATVTVYSDHSIVLSRLKVGFFLLIGQVLVLSTVLTVMFIWAIRRYLRIPLEHFIGEIDSVSAEKEEGGHFDFNLTVEYAEFVPLVDVLKEMGEKIAKQLQKVGSSEENLLQSKKDLQELAGRLLSVQENERRRLARELHDDLAQRMALLAIEAGKLDIEECNPGAQGILQNLKDKLIDISEDIHRISRQLHPSIIEDLGLVEALKSEINSFSRLEEIPVNFEPEPGLDNPPMDIAVSLFRVTQESLRNIKKHAHARNVTVQLAREDGSLLLTVSDDGRGFSPDVVRNHPGLGLKSMRERMRLINGSISYMSRQGQGTIVKARVDMPT
jgi:signal transduction histidine kinase